MKISKETVIDWLERVFERHMALEDMDAKMVALKSAEILASLNGWNVNVNHCMKQTKRR